MSDDLSDMLKPKKPASTGSATVPLQINPTIRMGAPKISIPEIKIPEVKIPPAEPVDMTPVALAMSEMSKALQRLAVVQTSILEALSKMPTPRVDVVNEAPEIRIPKRPNNFSVELEKENGETVGMRISAD